MAGISRGTRKNIIDWLSAEQVNWSGRLDGVAFLERIFDLNSLPSTDYRFHTARGDIIQHTISNDDWDADWVYHDSRLGLLHLPDDELLLFLAEMLHPLVRDQADATALSAELNDLLQADGYELVVAARIGGRPVWIGRRRTLRGRAALPSVRNARDQFTANYMLQQITRMESAVESDPALAIGTAKELLETTCKAILEARDVPTEKREDLPQLVRRAAEVLKLLPSQSRSSKDPETVRKVLGSLGILTAGMAELRNQYGTGHGRAPSAQGLAPRHAKLAVGAAATLAVFLYETHEERSRQP
jgi:hypothetical protein